MHGTITTIIVTPVPDRPGYFIATLSGARLCVSREPLLAAARELIQRGALADTTLVMRHAGADYDALRGPLGALARLTVDEDGGGTGTPKFRRWRADQTMDQRPPMRFSGRGLPDIGATVFQRAIAGARR